MREIVSQISEVGLNVGQRCIRPLVYEFILVGPMHAEPLKAKYSCDMYLPSAVSLTGRCPSAVAVAA